MREQTNLPLGMRDLDTEAEEAPPRVGHVLDKLVLFSSMEAKALETPSLSRRKSGEFNKVTRTASFSQNPQPFSMGHLDNIPLQRTLERITQTQAQLSKPEMSSMSQKILSKDENDWESQKSPKKAPSDIIREQERLLTQAKQNLLNQRQHVEKLDLREEADTLPKRLESAKSDIRSKDSFSRDKLEITETDKINPERQQSSGLERASSFKGNFDFTKTPRSFMNRRKFSEPTPDPAKPEAPKLEFLSANVTRKYSAPDKDHVRQARLDFFEDANKIDENTRSLPKKQSSSSMRGELSRNVQQFPSSKDRIPDLPAKKTLEPYYAKPISPPRPVTPPRPVSPTSDSSSPPPPRPILPKQRPYRSLGSSDQVDINEIDCSEKSSGRQNSRIPQPRNTNIPLGKISIE